MQITISSGKLLIIKEELLEELETLDKERTIGLDIIDINNGTYFIEVNPVATEVPGNFIGLTTSKNGFEFTMYERDQRENEEEFVQAEELLDLIFLDNSTYIVSDYENINSENIIEITKVGEYDIALFKNVIMQD